MVIFKYALLRGVRNPGSLVLNFLLPFSVMFVGPFWQGQNPFGFSLVGLLLMSGAFVAARGIINDRMEGTIIRVLAGPTTTFRYLAQNLLACLVPMAAQIVIIVIIGGIRYDWTLGFVIWIGLCYTVFAVASVALSFAWSCLFKQKETSYSVFSVVITLAAMLGGFMMPVQFIPAFLRHIGALFPPFWASRAITDILNYGSPTANYLLSLGALLLFSAAYLLYGGKRKIL